VLRDTRVQRDRRRGLSDFGTIEAGKLADLLILTADPLADISSLREIVAVLKEGRVVDCEGLPIDQPFA